jgi:NADH-quinone oxidoreductase subunit C
MSPTLEQLTERFTALIGPAVAVAGLAEAGPGSTTPATTAAAPVSPIRTCDHALKGYHFDATVAADQVVAAAEILNRAGFGLDTITGVDWIAQNEMEVVYDYFHPTSPLRVVVRTRIAREAAEVPTIGGVFSGANWHERETHDFFGIRFAGHPNLKPFLLPEDADFHPLRKDYKP